METAGVKRTIGFYQLILTAVLLVIAWFIMAPFFWMFATSLRPAMDSFKLPPSLWPSVFEWDNYAAVFASIPFAAFFWNSMKVSVLVGLAQVASSATAAYAFARLRFPGRDALFILVLSALMIPHQVTIIPLFIMIRKLGWMDTHAALIVPHMIYPFGIFLLKQFMSTIPTELEEAARVDGASRYRIFREVIVPISMPSISVVAVFSFIASWNMFFSPLLFINTYEKMTLPLGITILQGYMGNGNMSALLAGVTMSLVPVVLFYIFCQKYLVDGTTVGAVKG
ncbi:carbohydrate ABC transporter permease [Paenibacillus piri]|uniref:Carbohydrate ABC transporter permease n=1 Tax=Paenibacillus piri TaxID=2547395 RepID=A0A4V2ZTY0_9BACL|nr:carbohydrate ABC transporter permease [Paenibacillus piri]TDF98804.1 carbohydrate ABC transporter permease [Paenibacillus piri]